MRTLTVAVLLLSTTGCSLRFGSAPPTVTIELTGTPTKSWLDVAAQCMGTPVDWSVSESSNEPNVGRIEVPEATLAEREGSAVTCLQQQPGVTSVEVKR